MFGWVLTSLIAASLSLVNAQDSSERERATGALMRCDLNNIAQDCAYAGQAYFNGRGFTQDYAAALRLFDQACRLNSFEGCYNAGYIYLAGLGPAANNSGSSNYAQADPYFRKACFEGNMMDACASLATVIQPTNRSEALRLYQRACEGGSQRGCTMARVMRN